MPPSKLDPWQDDTKSGGFGCTLLTILVGIGFVLSVAIISWRHAAEQDPRPAPPAVARPAATERDVDQVKATAGRLTLPDDNGDHRTMFLRNEQPEIWYRVTLDDVPLGQSLELECEWTDANGKSAHRNRYRTKPMTHSPWNTHARYRLSPAAAAGSWQVRLLLDDRTLHRLQFEVK